MNILSSIKSINTLNHLSQHRSCNMKSSDEETDYYRVDIIKCKPPQLKALGCTRESIVGYEQEEQKEKTQLVEMDCNICGRNVHTFGKLRSDPDGDHLTDTEGNPMPHAEGHDVILYGFTHMRTKENFSDIKQACIQLAEEKLGQTYFNTEYGSFEKIPGTLQTLTLDEIKAFKSIEDIFNISAVGGGNAPLFLFEKPNLTLLGLPGLGKTCTKDEEEEAEVAAFMAASVDDTPAAPPGLDISYIFNSKDGSPLKIEGLDGLMSSWQYRVYENKESQSYVEKSIENYMFLNKKPVVAFKLDTTDLTANIHHLIFEKTAPQPTQLEEYLNKNMLLSVESRIINPICDPKKIEEHLNISIVATNKILITERYKISCKMQNRKRILSLEKLK